MQRSSLAPLVIALFVLLSPLSVKGAYHVSTSGNNTTGNGSLAAPWATITAALDSVPDGALILVHAGTYSGRVRLRGSFNQGVTVRSEPPYQARLRNNGPVMTSYDNNIRGITIEGFDMAHSGSGASGLVVHLDGGGTGQVSRIILQNNIFHDSYNNDLLKINNGISGIIVRGNVFYNQSGSDEHIDINSAEDISVEGNIFFNDFEGSGRSNNNDTSSYIVIKDSNGTGDIYTGSRNVQISRNIFLNWQGSTGSSFVLVGEDGNSYFEGVDITIENNLMLGNSTNVMRAPFGVKGGKNIVFRNNTVSGDLPSLAYAMRLNREGANPPNENIQMYNNIWSDQSGSMGSTGSGSNDFSDTPPADTVSFVLSNNLYWNGGAAIPGDGAELVNYTDDASPVVADPGLQAPINVVLPRWQQSQDSFGGGHATIVQAFTSLAGGYCRLPGGSAAVNSGSGAHSPGDDLFGSKRPSGSAVDRGACEYQQGSGGGGGGSSGSVVSPLHLLLRD